jgi:hypothetical protein
MGKQFFYNENNASFCGVEGFRLLNSTVSQVFYEINFEVFHFDISFLLRVL